MNWTWFYRLVDVLRVILDIGIVWLVIYYLLKIFRNNTRTIQIVKGILIVIFVKLVAGLFQLPTLNYIMDYLLNWGFLAVIVIFQPEIRSLLERVGKSSTLTRISVLTGDEKTRLIDQLVEAVSQMSSTRTGALITLEQGQSLEDFIKTGTPMNSIVTKELLTSIFVTSTPLHDGAVIIRGDKIAVASAYFPPTIQELPARFGARHRAAVGISEITDSVTIVVSEESGSISIAEEGKLTLVNEKTLREYLHSVIQISENNEWTAFNKVDAKTDELLKEDYSELSISEVAKKKEAEHDE